MAGFGSDMEEWPPGSLLLCPPILLQPFLLGGTRPCEQLSLGKGNSPTLWSPACPPCIFSPTEESAAQARASKTGQTQGLSVTGFGMGPFPHFPGTSQESPSRHNLGAL